MKVMFDNQIFDWQLYGGISKYFSELNRNLRLLNVNSKIIAPINVCSYLAKQEGVIGITVQPLPHGNRLLKKGNMLSCKTVEAIWAPEIVHHTYYDFKKTKGSKHIITVYDMTHEKISEEIPNSKEFIKIKRDAIMKADKIIAISNATRDDIIDFTNVPSERIVTVCLAATKVDLNLNNDSIWSKPYVLYVGARTLYKNFKNYLKACSKLEYDGDFLFLGGGRFTGDEIMLIDELKLSGRTFQVRGDELISKKLYMNADLFVYPSRYEGFGIPLLEAFQCRCKVVASDIKPFREIMGDEIEYFDPNDVDNMTYVIHNSLSKTAPSSEAAEKMTRKYSWENCAIQTLDVYKDLLTSK